TIASLGEDYNEGSCGFYAWILRHHRYETAYIHRRELGYLPVLSQPGEFSVCVEDKNGARIRRDYTMTGNTVRPAGIRPCEVKPEGESDDLDALPVKAPAPKPVAEKSVTEK